MRVLMVNTPQSPQFGGGDLVQMREPARELKALGVDVDLSFDLHPDARGYDIAHVFNLRTVRATGAQVAHLKKYGIPIVLSPIYINPSLGLWAIAALRWIFCKNRSDSEIEGMLEKFATYKPKIQVKPGVVYTAHGDNRPSRKFNALQRRILESADWVAANSNAEIRALQRDLHFLPNRASCVPYAVSSSIGANADPDAFRKTHDLREFVLCVGRVEWSKNQLLLAMACRRLDIPLVLIGKRLQPEYVDLCIRHGPRRLIFIDHSPQQELGSAYRAASVHVLPSWIETCGLTTMEALANGCPAVASNAGYEYDHFGNSVSYCDPAIVASLTDHITQKAFASPEATVAHLISWQQHAVILNSAYENCMTVRVKLSASQT